MRTVIGRTEHYIFFNDENGEIKPNKERIKLFVEHYKDITKPKKEMLVREYILKNKKK